MSAARDQSWPWGVVSDIDADIEHRIAEFGYAGQYAADVRVGMRRGYRPHSDEAFLRYPRKEDNMEMVAASWQLDVDAAHDEVTCPLAIGIAADFGPRFPDPSLVEGRRQDLRALKDRLPDLHSVEFPCGHDVPGLMPTELAAFITD